VNRPLPKSPVFRLRPRWEDLGPPPLQSFGRGAGPDWTDPRESRGPPHRPLMSLPTAKPPNVTPPGISTGQAAGYTPKSTPEGPPPFPPQTHLADHTCQGHGLPRPPPRERGLPYGSRGTFSLPLPHHPPLPPPPPTPPPPPPLGNFTGGSETLSEPGVLPSKRNCYTWVFLVFFEIGPSFFFGALALVEGGKMSPVFSSGVFDLTRNGGTPRYLTVKSRFSPFEPLPVLLFVGTYQEVPEFLHPPE